jgi:hypothetical protein
LSVTDVQGLIVIEIEQLQVILDGVSILALKQGLSVSHVGITVTVNILI